MFLVTRYFGPDWKTEKFTDRSAANNRALELAILPETSRVDVEVEGGDPDNPLWVVRPG